MGKGFRSKNNLVRVIPSSRDDAEAWYVFIINKKIMMEEYTRRPLYWDSVILLLSDYGYCIDEFESFDCEAIDSPDSKIVVQKKCDEGIYIIQCEHGGPIKIGQTDNITARIAQLQIGNPYELVLLHFRSNMPNGTEAILHKKYAQYNIRGEWFDENILPRVIQDINDIANGKNLKVH